MVIENKKAIIANHLLKFILLVVIAAFIAILFYFDIVSEMVRTIVAWGLIGFYVFYFCWGIVCNHYYFYFSDLSLSKLVFKFYSLVPLSQKQQTVEIAKNSFHSFRFTEKWYGLRQYIVLSQVTPRGIAQYPPISISLLNEAQKKALSDTLKRFQKVAGNG
jgi:hypothetical protein